MSKTTFIFIAGFFLSLALFSGDPNYESNVYVVISIALIALLGIPHGAIDHILAMKKTTIKPLVFYSAYLGSIAAYVLAWLYFPKVSMVAFLLVSAYHFGQSQFSDIDGNPWFKRLWYLSWGTSILSGLIYYNQAEILELNTSIADMTTFLPVFDAEIHFILLIASTALALGILVYKVATGKIKPQRLGVELFVFALIHVCFYLLPILAGFTLYFVILHSLRVMVDEYTFLRKEDFNLNPKKFIGLLLPYSVISLVGSGLILLLSRLELLPMSNLLLVFVLISVITLPHSVVMERFYKED